MSLCHRTLKILVKPKNDSQNFKENYKKLRVEAKKNMSDSLKTIFFNVWATFEGKAFLS